MQSRKILSTLLLSVLAAANTVAMASENLLLGCWRSQQVQLSFADQKQSAQNGDCVTEYSATQSRTRCYQTQGEKEFLAKVEFNGPRQLRYTPIESSSGKALAAAAEISYQIDGQWLLIERQLPATASDAKQPKSIKSMLIRVPDVAGKSDCAPRGKSLVRVDQGFKSALRLTAPTGWQAWMKDPASDANLSAVVGSHFLLGLFRPAGENVEKTKPDQLMIIYDDARYGAVVTQAEQFKTIKQSFTREFKPEQILCDLPDRICVVENFAAGNVVYMELLNIKGRVVVITASLRNTVPGKLEQLKKNARIFVEQLQRDNPA